MQDLLQKASTGFSSLSVDQSFKDQALAFLKTWLSEEEYKDYVPQIEHLIDKADWDYLLDCFYQVIPFGTGGRRGEVGIGPNRINKWTIQASAQGHSQYLIKNHGEEAKTRGVVLSYDVRQFFTNKHFNDTLPNPVRNLNCKDLALAAAEVYMANGIVVHIFDDVRTTPELSFAIRHLHAVAGDMFSASHNPADHNGKKVYDEFGGQLIPPFDEKLVNEVTQNVKEIKKISVEDGTKNKLFSIISKSVDEAYIQAASDLSLSSARDVSIVYTPLHGTGVTSILPVLKKLGFVVDVDPKTGYKSGKFENVTFNIPNPEVVQSFDTPLGYAKQKNADILLNSDPDADRVGIMVNHKGEWIYINGNELGALLTSYVVDKRGQKGRGVVIKTAVTTNLATKICKDNNIEIIGELPVGFKYIGEEMNKLEKEGRIDDLFIGLEESHGFIAGNYLRDKDAVVGALWLAELAAEMKKENKTIIDYLNSVYTRYGFFRNHLTEIRLPGAEGMQNIKKIQDELRSKPFSKLGRFEVDHVEDFLDRKPIVSETDRASKNLLVFHFKPQENIQSMRVTVRPSGTEPKSKMYIEIGSSPFDDSQLEQVKIDMENVLQEIEKLFMTYCYKIIGIDFPERGFLLFWQLPVKDKMKYFEIEPEIVKLKEIADTGERKAKLMTMLEFLGNDPLEKVNKAFEKEYGSTIENYLKIESDKIK